VKARVFLFACTSLSLAACSGGSGGGGGGGLSSGGGTPPASYPTLPLTASAEFQVSNAAVVSINRSNTPAHSDSLVIQYDAATRTYALNGAGWGDTFGPAQLQAPPVGATPSADSYRSASNPPNFFTVNRSGSDSPGAATRYTYVTWGVWTRNQPNSTIVFGVAGYQTTAADLPKSGSATYSGQVQGVLSDATGVYSLASTSTAGLTANFSTASVTTTMALSGKLNPTAATLDFGTYTGTAGISAAAGYQGALTGSTGYNGAFDGAFYGPAATDTGYTFTLNRNPGESAAGLFVAKKP
jgi:hypothetical protein